VVLNGGVVNGESLNGGILNDGNSNGGILCDIGTGDIRLSSSAFYFHFHFVLRLHGVLRVPLKLILIRRIHKIKLILE
jgi:hypothetical protein